jgi:TonB family protein
VRAEIEVVLDGNGAVVSARVTRPSGRRRFDQEALAAVKRDIESHVPVDARQGVVTRWSVEAQVAVAGPLAAGFGFDEVTGKVKGVYPMKRETRTKVALLSVTPRR